MSTRVLVTIRSLSLLVFLSQMAACLVAHPLDEYSGGPPSAEAGYAADGRDGPDADGGPAETGAASPSDASELDSGTASLDAAHADADADADAGADGAWDATGMDAGADVTEDIRMVEGGVDAALDGPVTPPVVRFDPDNKWDFGSLFVGEEEAHTFQIVNDGPGDVQALTSTIRAMTRTSPFRVSSTTCDRHPVLLSGTRCSVTVTAKPSIAAVGTRDYLRATYLWAGESWSVEALLTVSATKAARLTLSPSSQPFPDTLIGSSSTHSFVLQNTGDAAAVLGDVSTPGLQLSSPFALQTGSTTCSTGDTLAAGGNCRVYVTFTPTTTSTHDGKIVLAYSGGPSTTASADLSGKGLEGPKLSFGIESYDCGTAAIGNSIECVLTLTNTGDAAGKIESTLSTQGLGLGSSSYSFVTSSCSNLTPLAPQAACTITIRFAPRAVGQPGGNMFLQYTGGLVPATAQVRLTGQGTT